MAEAEPAPDGVSGWSIRRAVVGDLPALLGVFDAAVTWLASRGLEEQWGRAPFSAQPALVGEFRSWIRDGRTWVAAGRSGLVGAVTGGRAPSYAPVESGPELYVQGLVAGRAPQSRGVGLALLRHAEQLARETACRQIRLDCWDGGGGQLVRYYERAGFIPGERVSVGGWRGRILAKEVVPGCKLPESGGPGGAPL